MPQIRYYSLFPSSTPLYIYINSYLQDGDGRISREEWRNWILDKHNLIQEHNQIKNSLMSEIKNLRKALTPTTEQAFQEIKKLEDLKKQQEEELVHVHIENDRLQVNKYLLQHEFDTNHHLDRRNSKHLH
jgi:hypothetical protein